MKRERLEKLLSHAATLGIFTGRYAASPWTPHQSTAQQARDIAASIIKKMETNPS